MSIDFRELNYILTVAQAKSVSLAAQKLLVSQPTVSLAISQVEAQLDTKLFEREAQGMRLTLEGERFLHTARNIMTLKNQLDQELKQLSEAGAKRIILGISSLWAECLLPRVLPVCKARFPDVRINVREETTSVLTRWLASGDIDLAVLTEPKLPATLRLHKLFRERLLIAAAQSNTIAAGYSPGRSQNTDYPYLEPKLLTGQRFILSRQNMRLRQSADAFLKAQNIEPKIAVTAANIQTAHRLAALGVGIAFIPERFVTELAQPPYPVYFKTDDTLASWLVGIACDDRRENALAKAFICIFEDILRGPRTAS